MEATTTTTTTSSSSSNSNDSRRLEFKVTVVPSDTEYVVYKVETSSKAGTVATQHRFRDFTWLRDQLRLANPVHGDSDEVRVRELRRFLERVAQHPLLKQCDDLLFFLRASIEDVDKRRAETPKQNKSRPSVFRRAFSKQPEDPDGWLTKTKNQTCKIRALLQDMGVTGARFQQKCLDLSKHYLVHEQHARVFADQTQHNDQTTRAFSVLADACRRTTECMESFMAAFHGGFYSDICDYQRELDAVGEVLDDLDDTKDEDMRAAMLRTARAEITRLKEQRREDLATMAKTYALAQQKLNANLARFWESAADRIRKAK